MSFVKSCLCWLWHIILLFLRDSHDTFLTLKIFIQCLCVSHFSPRIMPGLLYACSYDDEWYFGVANCISVKNYDMNIKFLQPNGPVAQFFRPSLEDTCWIPINDIMTKVDPPSYKSTGRFYCFDCDKMNCLKKLV